jgi:hypothetical protein
MKRRIIIAVALIAAPAFILIYYFYLGSAVPPGQQPLISLNSSNAASLKDAFNSSANSVRLIVMLSPT